MGNLDRRDIDEEVLEAERGDKFQEVIDDLFSNESSGIHGFFKRTDDNKALVDKLIKLENRLDFRKIFEEARVDRVVSGRKVIQVLMGLFKNFGEFVESEPNIVFIDTQISQEELMAKIQHAFGEIAKLFEDTPSVSRDYFLDELNKTGQAVHAGKGEKPSVREGAILDVSPKSSLRFPLTAPEAPTDTRTKSRFDTGSYDLEEILIEAFDEFVKATKITKGGKGQINDGFSREGFMRDALKEIRRTADMLLRLKAKDWIQEIRSEDSSNLVPKITEKMMRALQDITVAHRDRFVSKFFIYCNVQGNEDLLVDVQKSILDEVSVYIANKPITIAPPGRRALTKRPSFRPYKSSPLETQPASNGSAHIPTQRPPDLHPKGVVFEFPDQRNTDEKLANPDRSTALTQPRMPKFDHVELGDDYDIGQSGSADDTMRGSALSNRPTRNVPETSYRTPGFYDQDELPPLPPHTMSSGAQTLTQKLQSSAPSPLPAVEIGSDFSDLAESSDDKTSPQAVQPVQESIAEKIVIAVEKMDQVATKKPTVEAPLLQDVVSSDDALPEGIKVRKEDRGIIMPPAPLVSQQNGASSEVHQRLPEPIPSNGLATTQPAVPQQIRMKSMLEAGLAQTQNRSAATPVKITQMEIKPSVTIQNSPLPQQAPKALPVEEPKKGWWSGVKKWAKDLLPGKRTLAVAGAALGIGAVSLGAYELHKSQSQKNPSVELANKNTAASASVSVKSSPSVTVAPKATAAPIIAVAPTASLKNSTTTGSSIINPVASSPIAVPTVAKEKAAEQAPVVTPRAQPGLTVETPLKPYAEVLKKAVDNHDTRLQQILKDGNLEIQGNGAGYIAQIMAPFSAGATPEQMQRINNLKAKINIGAYASYMKRFGDLTPSEFTHILHNSSDPRHNLLQTVVKLIGPREQWSRNVHGEKYEKIHADALRYYEERFEGEFLASGLDSRNPGDIHNGAWGRDVVAMRLPGSAKTVTLAGGQTLEYSGAESGKYLTVIRDLASIRGWELPSSASSAPDQIQKTPSQLDIQAPAPKTHDDKHGLNEHHTQKFPEKYGFQMKHNDPTIESIDAEWDAIAEQHASLEKNVLEKTAAKKSVQSLDSKDSDPEIEETYTEIHAADLVEMDRRTALLERGEVVIGSEDGENVSVLAALENGFMQECSTLEQQERIQQRVRKIKMSTFEEYDVLENGKVYGKINAADLEDLKKIVA